MGFSNLCVLIFSRRTKFWLINFPPAPVSSNALVLTVLSFGLSIEIEIGSDMDLFTILATITFEIVMEGMADVKAGFFKQNPSQQ